MDETIEKLKNMEADELFATLERCNAARVTAETMLREVLEELTLRESGYLQSDISPGNPAPNYELMLRLNLGHLLGLEITDA